MSSFRDRLYRAYVRGHDDSYAPRELSALDSGEHYRRRLIARHFPERRDAAILDLGCGHGNLLHLAHQAGYARAWGVDRSPEQVREAARLGIEGVREGDLLETLAGQPDRSLDAVIAFDVLEHLTRDELLDVAEHTARVLAPGGRFLIHVPNGGAPFGGTVLWGDLTHERAFTPASLGQLLRPAGFSSLTCHEDTPIVHSAASALRWMVWAVVRTGARLWLAAETGERSPILTQNFLAVAIR